MPANIKEFVIVNNYGNLFTGDNLRDTSFTASKTYSGAVGPTCVDVVLVIGTTTKVCLDPGDTVTTTYTKGSQLGADANTTSGGNQNSTGVMQAVPNTDDFDSAPGL
ncbi:hypothetical protein [Bacillus gaemokensis]|uniref:Uncharacterized protein n=1 Tax=Bacillus gaemokensis TaxID=574375 RepID=A0A073KQ71_9BACI|nr:hypothetical protein [Bacillus gaemokensis]KEK24533.1 hypothetical protein BAGA_25635 [Bacillus gaemokensis]KYG39423.1 hypothetical protein AZF08_05175 [Bacillus gaemokensis]